MHGQRGSEASMSAFTTFQYVPGPLTKKVPRQQSARSEGSQRTSFAGALLPEASGTLEAVDWRCAMLSHHLRTDFRYEIVLESLQFFLQEQSTVPSN